MEAKFTLKNLLIFSVFAFILVISACTKEEEPIEEDPMENTCVTEGVTYTADIQSIFSGCTSSNCHGADTGRSMVGYSDARAWAEKGRILGALRQEAGFTAMPAGGSKMDACRVSKIAAWINDGYPE